MTLCSVEYSPDGNINLKTLIHQLENINIPISQQKMEGSEIPAKSIPAFEIWKGSGNFLDILHHFSGYSSMCLPA